MGKFVNQITPLHNSGLKIGKEVAQFRELPNFFRQRPKNQRFFLNFPTKWHPAKENKCKSFNLNFRKLCLWLIDSWKKAVQTKNNFIRIEKKERKKVIRFRFL